MRQCGNATLQQCGIVAKANVATRVKRSKVFANRGICLCRNAALPQSGIAMLSHCHTVANGSRTRTKGEAIIWQILSASVLFHQNNLFSIIPLYRLLFGYGNPLRQCGNATLRQCGIVAKANVATRMKRSRAFANRGICLCRNAALPQSGSATLSHWSVRVPEAKKKQ